MLGKELGTQYGIEVRSNSVDFSVDGASATLEESVRDLDTGLVIPNAGVEGTGVFISHGLDMHWKTKRINVTVPTELAHLFGQRLAQRGRGGLLLVSSLLAYQAVS